AKSTGPKDTTRTRGNALTHGLTSAGYVLPDDGIVALEATRDAWRRKVEPTDCEEEVLVERLAFHAYQLRQAALQIAAQKGHEAARAVACWDLDRAAEAEALGRRLAQAPGAVRAELQRTWHGCAWLVGRWEALGGVLEQGGDWAPMQRLEAFFLLGLVPTPP